MSYKPMEVTFFLDGTGLYYHQADPIHLDAILAWALAPFHCNGEPPARDEQPFDIPLPLAKWHRDGTWGWMASALIPSGPTGHGLQFCRKKFRQNRVELTKGSPNLTNGVYRDYNTPLPLFLCAELKSYAVGDPKRVRHILKKQVKFLGKKRAYGKGAVVGIACNAVEEDWSMIKDGQATRWLPLADGPRVVRPRPPYWNNCGAVPCCEVGQVVNVKDYPV